ncbi:CHASE2 domain-containing protein [Microvirga roseola]|uniref:CHASE2 domain-containing protein n=1 Tax=Microvirga roseola TaxID=2883126 RepID=UPI001E387284|nr:adenylate/guanylate cyclase domain-containing protein [Microvirga roseola]
MGLFLVAVAALAAVVALRAADPVIIAALRDQTFDSYQRLTPRRSGEYPVRVVSIDERALSAFGQWPWPRLRLAELSERLAELGAATVAYSVLFAEPDRTSPARAIEQLAHSDAARAAIIRDALAGLPNHDEIFASSLQRVPTVLGFASTADASPDRPQIRSGFAFTGADPAMFLPTFQGAQTSLPGLEAVAQGIGGLSLGNGNVSGIVRRVPLLFSDGSSIYPSLITEAFRVAQGASTILVRSEGASQGQAASALTGMRVGQLYIPLTRNGEVWVYFDHDRPESYVSVADILEPGRREAVRRMIQGHIVFIGATAPGLADYRTTPLGETIPGVSVQAQIAEQILAGTFLTRPDWASGAELIATVLLGLLMVVLLMLLGAQYSFLAGGAIAATAIAVSWLAFSRTGYLIDPVYPSLGALAVYLVVTGAMHATTDRERRFVRRAFGQYLAPQLLHELEKAPHRMQLGGEVRPLTIMFMDVRAFTPISETLPAVDLVRFLNTLLSPLTDAIHAERGTIDKYIGDSIMAFWNAPLDVPDHAERACRAALRMQAIVHDLNMKDAFGFGAAGRSGLEVKIGIGINTGLACVGNMGSKSRFNYSAVGDAVNVAARIESCSKQYAVDIVVSEETARTVVGFALLEIGTVGLKGKATATKLFALAGDEAVACAPQFRETAHLHASLLGALESGNAEQAEMLAAMGCRSADPHIRGLFEHFRRVAQRLASGSEADAHHGAQDTKAS